MCCTSTLLAPLSCLRKDSAIAEVVATESTAVFEGLVPSASYLKEVPGRSSPRLIE